MRKHTFAATSFEIEAERRREVLDADARRFDMSDRARPIESGSAVGRLWSLLRGSPRRPMSRHGKLDQKHA